MGIGSLFRRGGGAVVSPGAFPDPEVDIEATDGAGEQTVVLAGGCFWCVEAVYKELDGVLEVTSGYSGDSAETATYERVCSGSTDHAEAVKIRFDPSRVTIGQLLKVFFSVAHDPTQVDRQGADVGRQYRSAVFYADEAQQRVAAAYIAQLDKASVFRAPMRRGSSQSKRSTRRRRITRTTQSGIRRNRTSLLTPSPRLPSYGSILAIA